MTQRFFLPNPTAPVMNTTDEAERKFLANPFWKLFVMAGYNSNGWWKNVADYGYVSDWTSTLGLVVVPEKLLKFLNTNHIVYKPKLESCGMVYRLFISKDVENLKKINDLYNEFYEHNLETNKESGYEYESESNYMVKIA